MLARKGDRRALKEPELVFSAELAKRNHRTTEGDSANRRAQEQLQPVTGRNRQTFGHDVEGIRLRHGGDGDKHSRQTNHAVHESHQLGHLGHLNAFGHQCARCSPNDQCTDHVHHAERFATGGFNNQRTGGEDGNGHADHAEQISAQRGGGV